MTHSTHCGLDSTRRKLRPVGVADLNSARQAWTLWDAVGAGCRCGLAWLVAVAGVLVVVGCSSLADARSSSSKEGAPRPPVNYAILWLSRVTEKENGAVVLLSSSVCLSTPKLRVTAEG